MQMLNKEQATLHSVPAIVDAEWSDFLPALPAGDEKRELIEARAALEQAEMVLGMQEERIRVLEALTLTDELTGLANRRGFTAAFERELALASRDTSGGGLLVMIDLDGFKGINDRLGHQAGDAYLQAVASVLQEGTRASDTVARLGGDEFAVLLTRMEEECGAKRMAKLERFFNNRGLMWGGKRFPLRGSFGLAPYNGTSVTEAVIQMADARLYARKAHGKKLITCS